VSLRAFLALVLLAVGFSLALPSEGVHATCGSAGSTSAHASTSSGSFLLSADKSKTKTCGEKIGAASPMPPGHWITVPMCDAGNTVTCASKLLCPNGQVRRDQWYSLDGGGITGEHQFCPGNADTGPTLADIQTAFTQLPMTASPLHIQPPGGETLVNFDTIYFTDPTVIDKQITLLGATVDFHITAATYTWHYGDGQAQTTTDPGAAYPHQAITHRYLRKGTAAPSLDTTYQADYRINGGTWQHLGQTVTIPGAPQTITIRTATPHLVDSDG